MKKTIDTIQIVRSIRDENYKRTKNMSRNELMADIKKRSADARQKVERIKVQKKA